jgi:hypothetical protein
LSGTGWLASCCFRRPVLANQAITEAAMPKKSPDSEDQPKPKQPREVSSLYTSDMGLLEAVYDRSKRSTRFAYLTSNGKPAYCASYEHPADGQIYVPLSPTNTFVERQIILFPSQSTEYADELTLLNSIIDFIHAYLDVAPYIERILAGYVMFSWVADSFEELAYIRAIGDFGTGKTRLLKVVGALCYKPIFANGPTSVSAIFRMLDEHKGTLVLDEADYAESGEQAEIVKILNGGFSKGMPVIKSESVRKGAFNPTAFDTYGPKVIATRNHFKDRALESRCITLHMISKKSRADIPRNLDRAAFEREAEAIRNQLLTYRLHKQDRNLIDRSLNELDLEGRLVQIAVPLLSIVPDPRIKDELITHLREQFESLTTDRGIGLDGQILEAVSAVYQAGNQEPTLKDILNKYVLLFANDEEDKWLTSRRIGSRLRSIAHVNTRRKANGYYLSREDRPKIEQALRRYGIVQGDPVAAAKEIFEQEPTPPSQRSFQPSLLDEGSEGNTPAR